MATAELFTAIYSKFTADTTFKAAVSSQLYPYKGDEDSTFPFAVFTLLAEDTDYTFLTNIETFQIQFSLYDNKVSPVTVTDAQQKLWDLYDDATLTVSGYGQLSMIRGQTTLNRGEVSDPELWASHTVYEVMLQKS